MHMLETFHDIFNAGAQPWISHEHVLHEIDEVHIIADPIELVLSEEGLTGPGHSEMKLQVVRGVEEEVPGEELIEKASSAPHV